MSLFEQTVDTGKGVWTCRQHDGGSWEIVDPQGEIVGCFGTAGMMGIHLAMALAENRAMRPRLSHQVVRGED